MTDLPANTEPSDLPTAAEQRPVPDDTQVIRDPYFAAWWRGVVTWWFYVANFIVIAVVLVGSGRSTESVLLLPGFISQAAVLGIWLGVGGSPLWKRCLGFALSYYWMRTSLQQVAVGQAILIVVCGGWILTMALWVATIRAVICLVLRRPIAHQFSLAKLFGATAAAGLTLAIWKTPLGLFLQDAWRSEDLLTNVLWFVISACLVAVIALPALFRATKSRWRAFYVSISIIFGSFVCLTLIGVFGYGENVLPYFDFGMFLVLMCLLFSSAIYPAEIVLKRWGMDLVRPIAAEEIKEQEIERGPTTDEEPGLSR